MENPKRLIPQKDTLIRLFAKSANKCSYPDCQNHLFSFADVFVGQICHISGVMPDSARFNIDMSNEEKRQYDNLILLCHEHHIMIDQRPDEYPAELLKKLKRNHEDSVISTFDLSDEKFTNIVSHHYKGIDEKLDRIINLEAKDEHLKTPIKYHKKMDSLKVIKSKKAKIFTIVWVICWICIILYNRLFFVTKINPLINLVLITVFFLVMLGLAPIVLSFIFPKNLEGFLRGTFYKRLENSDIEIYSKIAQCPFPECKGVVCLNSPPIREKNKHKLVGCCSRENKLHTFSYESGDIGRYYLMDFRNQNEN